MLCRKEETGFFDDFNQDRLDVRYVSPRASYEAFADCKSRAGYVRLTGRESMNSLHHVSLLAVRQQEMAVCSETAMEFAPDYPEQLAGLAYMYDAMNFYIFGKTVTEEGKAVLTLVKSATVTLYAFKQVGKFMRDGVYHKEMRE